MQKYSVSVLIFAINEDISLTKTLETILSRCDHADLAEIFFLVGRKATENCLMAIHNELEKGYDIPICIFRQTYDGPGANWDEIFDRFQGTHFITMAADGEVDADQVCTLISQSKAAPNYVIVASRWLKKDSCKDYGTAKRLLNHCAHLFLRVLYCTKRTELTQPFLIAPTEVFRAFRWEEQYHPVFIEMMLKPLRAQIKVKEVPTVWKKRTEGRPNRSALYFLPYFRTAVKIRFMQKSRIFKPGRTIPKQYLEKGDTRK